MTMLSRLAPAGRRAVLLCAIALTGLAQEPPRAASATPPQTPAGIDSPWGVSAFMEDLLKQNQKLTPLLKQMNPGLWYNKGASNVYIQQWQMAQRQLDDVVTCSKLLAQNTESLPVALDVYFRIEALELTARSLEEGVRRYGDRLQADQLAGLIARNFGARERFRDYIRDLATTQQQNFKSADEEAQRCRGMISREPQTKRLKKY
jgi:hypothetical protein